MLELSIVQYQGYHTLQRIYHQQKLKYRQNWNSQVWVTGKLKKLKKGMVIILVRISTKSMLIVAATTIYIMHYQTTPSSKKELK